MTILDHVRAGKSFRDLPPSSEGSKMGGEWAKLRVLDKFEIVVLRESDSVSKIFPPVAYRAHIMEELHRSGKKEIPSSFASAYIIPGQISRMMLGHMSNRAKNALNLCPVNHRPELQVSIYLSMG